MCWYKARMGRVCAERVRCMCEKVYVAKSGMLVGSWPKCGSVCVRASATRGNGSVGSHAAGCGLQYSVQCRAAVSKRQRRAGWWLVWENIRAPVTHSSLSTATYRQVHTHSANSQQQQQQHHANQPASSANSPTTTSEHSRHRQARNTVRDSIVPRPVEQRRRSAFHSVYQRRLPLHAGAPVFRSRPDAILVARHAALRLSHA